LSAGSNTTITTTTIHHYQLNSLDLTPFLLSILLIIFYT